MNLTPTALIDALLRAEKRSLAAVENVLRDVPLGQLPTLVWKLSHEVNAAAGRWPAPEDEWEPDAARRAHAGYGRGLRDPWTLAGERSYQRERKRRHRAERTGSPGLSTDAGSVSVQVVKPVHRIDQETARIDGRACNASGMEINERRAG